MDLHKKSKIGQEERGEKREEDSKRSSSLKGIEERREEEEKDLGFQKRMSSSHLQ